MDSKKEIAIIGPNGEKRAASLSWYERRWTEGDCNPTECVIDFRADGFDIQTRGFDVFDAFCKLRDQLAAHGFYPFCYGASRYVHASGMLRDFSGGHLAYKFQMGRPVLPEDIVDIFATGPDVEVSTVAEQKAFWLKFLGR